ncbi:MAG: ABC transporter permease, partial [Clostridia bacterium]|nr:ABC transporter permease [Clostridia bacterium]
GNDRDIYEYQQYRKFGYMEYINYSEYVTNRFKASDGEDYGNNQEYKDAVQCIKQLKDDEDLRACENQVLQDFLKEYESQGYTVRFLPIERYKNGRAKSGSVAYLVATKDTNVFVRFFRYVTGFFKVETTKDVEDPTLADEDRYIRLEKDPYSGLFAVVGSGTNHKYLLYFDGRFPFIHQNWLTINLGTSYTRFRNQEITTVITQEQGNIVSSRQQYPTMIGTDEYVDSAINFHTVRYNKSWADLKEAKKEELLSEFGDRYTEADYHLDGLSMIETSFVIGLIAVFLAYLIGLPLGVLMARKKDKIADKIGNVYIIFIMAVPSLAYIFLFAAIGTEVFGLPYKFANAEVAILGYFLPIISLTLRDVGGLMKWMRRYMIDQMNSDYVKFARAEGLSEREIYRVHISRNAMIYLVHGIPGSILGCLVGAIITERVYSVPGVGNLLTTAINQHDNGIIIACTVFYTFLSILSIILGDLLLAKYDPRISLSSSKGGGR